MHSSFYLGQTNVSADGVNGALLESDSYERPCSQNAAQCAVRVFASWVPHTNLLLVIIRQDSHSQCFSQDSFSHCPLSQPPSILFGFSQNLPISSQDSSSEQQQQSNNQNVECIVSQPQERNKPIQCLRDDFLEDDADEETCSGTNMIRRKNWFITLFSSILMACCFGSAACSLCCNVCPSTRNSTTTRIMYSLMLLVGTLTSCFLLSHWLQNALAKDGWLCTITHTGELCEAIIGYQAVYRDPQTSFVNTPVFRCKKDS
uniref:Transmembrane protein n=1 Tax=Meloidogyne floridensis TaxID=298350 RepID=A0A915NLL6_9BILA